MKILFLSAANSIHTVKWVNAFAERGNEVHLVYNKNHVPQADKLNDRIVCHPLRYGGPLGYYLNAVQLRNLSKKILPDVINVHYASGYGTLARVAGIRPTLLSIWGSDVYEFPYKSKMNERILKKNVKHATMLASTSNCMAEQLRKVMDDESMEIGITPFGVDLNKFEPSKYVDSDSSYITIGNIKTLKSNYGIDILIDSIKILLDSLRKKGDIDIAKKIRVEIYGEGEQKQALLRQTTQLGLETVIQFKGKIANESVPEKLKRFDIFCAPSLYESFGVAIVEAMAMGVPVVVSDAEGFKEVVEDKETGIIVPKGNVEKLAEALEELVLNKEKRKKYGRQGRERVEVLYDWNKNVDMMEQLYEQLLTLKKAEREK